MDIMMPKMDGLQATRAIRAMQAERPDAEEIPIIAVSANAFAEDVQTSLDAGMNGHISKPLNVADVAKVIVRNLNKVKQLFANQDRWFAGKDKNSINRRSKGTAVNPLVIV